MRRPTRPDALVGRAPGRRVPYPGRPPVWLLRDRFARAKPPWAWRAWERARELYELDRADRYRLRRLTALIPMLAACAFHRGLRPETWTWNDRAWAAIGERAACRERLRSVRRDYHALWLEGRRRAARYPATDRMLRAVFPWWFDRLLTDLRYGEASRHDVASSPGGST